MSASYSSFVRVCDTDTIDAVVAQINANESRAGTLGDTLLKGGGSGTDPAAVHTLDDDDASESADGGTATLTAICMYCCVFMLLVLLSFCLCFCPYFILSHFKIS